MTALGGYVCGKSGLGGYHTPRHAIQPVSPPSFDLPTHPRTHTDNSMNTIPGSIVFLSFSFFLFTYTSLYRSFVLIMIMEIDHLEFTLLPKNPRQPHKVSSAIL